MVDGLALPAIDAVQESQMAQELPQTKIKKLRRKQKGSLLDSKNHSPSFMMKTEVRQSLDPRHKLELLSPGPSARNSQMIASPLAKKKLKRKRMNKSTIDKDQLMHSSKHRDANNDINMIELDP